MVTQRAQRTDRLNELAREAFFAGLEVHKQLGSGVLEKAYERCLAHELNLRNLSCQTQVAISLSYKGLSIPRAYYIDILVEEELVLELKCVEKVLDEHKAQTLTYLKHGGYHLGLLMNFRSPLFKDGVTRIVHDL